MHKVGLRNTMAVLAAFSLVALALVAGCQGVSQQGYQGAAVGAGVGGAAGALIDRRNRWRGGVIGAALGAVMGGSLAEISRQSSQQAAQYERPVQYRSSDGRQTLYAEPMGRRGGCTIIREKYYEDGRHVRTREREICR